MGFRIKTKYFLNAGSSIPQFEFNSSDNPYVKIPHRDKSQVQVNQN